MEPAPDDMDGLDVDEVHWEVLCVRAGYVRRCGGVGVVEGM